MVHRLKFSPCVMKHHAMGSGGTVPQFLNSGTERMGMVSFRPRTLIPLHQLNGMMGGPHSRHERFGEEKNLSPLPGLPSCGPVTTATAWSRFASFFYVRRNNNVSWPVFMTGRDCFALPHGFTIIDLSQTRKCIFWCFADRASQYNLSNLMHRMEEDDTIIVKWAQEDVETSYNLLNKKQEESKICNSIS